MEVKIQRPAYYFSWPDEEILDDKFLEITGDDETWLYRIERGGSFNGHHQSPAQPNYYHSPSGSVDCRTYTRRKHTLRPSLESVVESPLFNRSSLGILSTSQLNDTKLDQSVTPISKNREKTSSSFTASDKAPIPRIFKLDSPFMNNPFERKRHDSELSDISIIPSLDSQFDKNETMTDSLVNFLEKPNEKCQPPAGFQDEKPMAESLVSLSEKESGVEFSDEAMTDSMVNFLEPGPCQPPSGFGDEEMNSSIVNLDEKDILPASDMTNSLMDYLECGNMKTLLLTQSITSNEAENIPPEGLNNKEEEFSNYNHTERLMDEKPEGKLNDTFDTNREKDGMTEDDSEKSPEITFTNNVNMNRTNKREIINTREDRGFTRSSTTTFEKESESIHKSRALNNKDLNVTRDLNDEDVKETSKFKIPSKMNSSAILNSMRLNGTFTKSVDNSVRLNGTFTKSAYDSSRMNGTFTKNDFNSTSNISRKIPQRNSTFNTTFTKLEFPPLDVSKHMVTRSTEYLDAGAEDDRTSSASDSSFSSAASSNKPRSVDELRNIAQQQESNLQLQTSTPTEVTPSIKGLAQLNSVGLSPIRRASLDNRRVPEESRSAHSSPVRSSLPRSPGPHPISRLQQPGMEARRQTLQASSLSNLTITKPRPSGLRMPQPRGRLTMSARSEPRPSTAPTPAPTAIPRPQASRLPMPRTRATGIPTMKRGGRH